MVDPLSYVTFQPVLHCGMWYPVCGIVHIKQLMLLIERLAHVVAAVGLLSLSGPLPYV